jgi:tRNA(fMet)-specific endonuclease VapC
MITPDRLVVLDTNILVHWLRGKEVGDRIRREYQLGTRRPRPIVPVVVKAEIKSLALQLEWGAGKVETLDRLLRDLTPAEISSEVVIARYASLDHESRKLGRRMGKSDLWIAAVTATVQGVLLTSDADFDHLHPMFVNVERVDLADRE